MIVYFEIRFGLIMEILVQGSKTQILNAWLVSPIALFWVVCVSNWFAPSYWLERRMSWGINLGLFGLHFGLALVVCTKINRVFHVSNAQTYTNCYSKDTPPTHTQNLFASVNAYVRLAGADLLWEKSTVGWLVLIWYERKMLFAGCQQNRIACCLLVSSIHCCAILVPWW